MSGGILAAAAAAAATRQFHVKDRVAGSPVLRAAAPPKLAAKTPDLTFLIAPLLNPKDYPYLLEEHTKNPDPSVGGLLLTKEEIESAVQSKTLNKLRAPRWKRVHQFRDICSQYVENNSGTLSIKASNTPIHLTAKKLMQLFYAILHREFRGKKPEALETGAVVPLPTDVFFVRIFEEKIHIVQVTSAETIHEGSCSLIYNVFYITRPVFLAMKLITSNMSIGKTVSRLDIIRHEMQILSHLHKNGAERVCQQLPEVYFDFHREEHHYYLAAACTHRYRGDLFQYLEKTSLNMLQRIDLCFSVVDCMKVIWAKNVRHSDLAPENVFYEVDAKDKASVHISDFGGARSSAMRPPAPLLRRASSASLKEREALRDLLQRRNKCEDVTKMIDELEDKLDVCQLGTTLYFLLASTKEASGYFSIRYPHPLNHQDYPVEDAMYDSEFLLCQGYPQKLVDLIGRMVVLDTNPRLTTLEFLKKWNEYAAGWQKESGSKLYASEPSNCKAWQTTGVLLRQFVSKSEYPSLYKMIPAGIAPSQTAIAPDIKPFVDILNSYVDDNDFLRTKKSRQKTLLSASALMYLFHKLRQMPAIEYAALKKTGTFMVADGFQFLLSKEKSGLLHILLFTGAEQLTESDNARMIRALDVSSGSFVTFKYTLPDASGNNVATLKHEIRTLKFLHQKGKVAYFPSPAVREFNFNYQAKNLFGYCIDDDLTRLDGLLVSMERGKAGIVDRLTLCQRIAVPVQMLWNQGGRHNGLSIGAFLVRSIPDAPPIIVLTELGSCLIPALGGNVEKTFLPYYIGPNDFAALEAANKVQNVQLLDKIEFQIDMYALGTIFYMVLTNASTPYPMVVQSGDRCPKKGAAFDAKKLLDLKVPPKAVDLIGRMVAQDLSKRPTPQEFNKEWGGLVFRAPTAAAAGAPTAAAAAVAVAAAAGAHVKSDS